MLLFLKTKGKSVKNCFVIEVAEEIDGGVRFCNSHIFSTNCFELLMIKSKDTEYTNKFIASFKKLNVLKDWYTKTYVMGEKEYTFEEVIGKIKEILLKHAEDLDLQFDILEY